LVALALFSASCSSNAPAEIFVNVKTDLVPGIEFATVRTEVGVRDGSGGGGGGDVFHGVRIAEHVVRAEDDFERGVRVAEGEAPASNQVRLRVQLLGKRGLHVVERTALVTVGRSSVVTLIVSRDCRGVMCPAAGDDPTLAA
jgi:hypothetical protein